MIPSNNYFEFMVNQDLAGQPKRLPDLLADANHPVLVFFWTGHCPPCKIQKPVVQDLAQRYRGSLFTVRVDVGTKEFLARRYDITVVPAVLLFSGGEELLRLEGVMSCKKMSDQIDRTLANMMRMKRRSMAGNFKTD
jgi:thioredoxin 1